MSSNGNGSGHNNGHDLIYRGPRVTSNLYAFVRAGRGDYSALVPSEFAAEVARGCADLSEKLEAPMQFCEGFEVAFGKESEDAKRLTIAIKVAFKIGDDHIDIDHMIETSNAETTAQQIVRELGYRIVTRIREAQDRHKRALSALGLLGAHGSLAQRFEEPLIKLQPQ